MHTGLKQVFEFHSTFVYLIVLSIFPQSHTPTPATTPPTSPMLAPSMTTLPEGKLTLETLLLMEVTVTVRIVLTLTIMVISRSNDSFDNRKWYLWGREGFTINKQQCFELSANLRTSANRDTRREREREKCFCWNRQVGTKSENLFFLVKIWFRYPEFASLACLFGKLFQHNADGVLLITPCRKNSSKIGSAVPGY